MKKIIMTALTAVAIISSNSLIAAGNAEAGKAKSAACVACHGADGNSMTSNFPNLAAQGESYLVKQMADFKSGKRKDPTMSAMVISLDEQAMQDISAFYASQEVKIGTADPSKVKLGESIYKAGRLDKHVPACMSCHGPTGTGNPGASYPLLSGQKATYIEKQLHDFRNAVQNPDQKTAPVGRYNDTSSTMRNAVTHLNDYEIKALAQYIQGLHAK